MYLSKVEQMSYSLFTGGMNIPLRLVPKGLNIIQLFFPFGTSIIRNKYTVTPHQEQELLTLPEHLSWPQFLVGFLLLDLFCNVVLVSSSDYPFGIFKLFLISYKVLSEQKKNKIEVGGLFLYAVSKLLSTLINLLEISYKNRNNSCKL